MYYITINFSFAYTHRLDSLEKTGLDWIGFENFLSGTMIETIRQLYTISPSIPVTQTGEVWATQAMKLRRGAEPGLQ